MNPFVCAVDLAGRAVGMDALGSALAGLCAADGRLEYLLDGAWAGAWVPSSGFGRPAIVHRRGLLVLGNVRLGNRRELARELGAEAQPTDLELVAELFGRRGARSVADLVGSFAFAIWDARQQTLFAARDALGRQPLFYQRKGDRLVVASHLECLEQDGWDREFIAEFLLGRPPAGRRTVYRNAERLEAGCWLVGSGGRVATERYWTPDAFEPSSAPVDPREAAHELRGLLRRAVAVEIDGEPGVWSHLSGGLDSSAVVGMASRLAQQGAVPSSLGGTVTVVDSLGDGDETRFSDAVVRLWGLRNERLVDYWAWQPDDQGLPVFAEPRHFLPFFARDRAMCQAVRRGGGKVLLSGYGSDQYLSGSFDFIADLVAGRRYREAVDQLVELAITTRQSFWSLAWKHGLAPLRGRPTAPVTPGAATEWMTAELRDAAAAAAPGRFATQVAREVAATEGFLERGLFEEGLELRYPFLYRPLVEFGLRLPPALRVRPHQQKWILRQAVGDLLPPEVLHRTGKGGIDGRIAWSLERESTLLRRLIADSHLADLGLVNRDALSRAYERAREGLVPNVVGLFFTLSLETWLAARSGWWARHAPMLNTAGPPAGPAPTPRNKENADVQAVC